jgi:hypothetical protein
MGDAVLQIRTSKMLPPFVGSDDDTVRSGHVPKFNYVPNYSGYFFRGCLGWGANPGSF